MVDFNKIVDKAVPYMLVDGLGHIHKVGTHEECFEVMVNIYGDASAKALVDSGVQIKPARKGA